MGPVVRGRRLGFAVLTPPSRSAASITRTTSRRLEPPWLRVAGFQPDRPPQAARGGGLRTARRIFTSPPRIPSALGQLDDGGDAE